jgi:hypothetical protein
MVFIPPLLFNARGGLMKMILAILLAAALLFAGCAGGAQQQAPAQSNAPANAPSGTEQSAPPSPPAAPEQQTAPPAAPETQPSPQPQASAADTFIAAMGMATGWKVDYQVKSSAAPQVITMTLYSKIAGKENYKFRTDTAAAGMQVRAYVFGKSEMYSCVNQGSWSCFKLSAPKDDSLQSQQLADEVKSNPSKYTITEDGTKAIAGTTAKCYKLVSTDYTARYCISPEGVPLYIWYTATKDGVSIETETSATSYSLSVSDSDFTLPAAATSMPSGGSGQSSPRAMDCDETCGSMSGDQKAQCMLYCQANA